MFQTMVIGCALATSLFVLLSCWRRRPQPWLGSAASSCVHTAVFWTLMILPTGIWHSQRPESDLPVYGFSCCFLLSLASCITAFVLGLLSGAVRPAQPEGQGLSPSEEV